jgi:hypothetical protein
LVKARGVGSQEPLHARDQIRYRRFDNEMKVVTHQTVGMHLPVRLDADFSQRRREALPIFVIAED